MNISILQTFNNVYPTNKFRFKLFDGPAINHIVTPDFQTNQNRYKECAIQYWGVILSNDSLIC